MKNIPKNNFYQTLLFPHYIIYSYFSTRIAPKAQRVIHYFLCYLLFHCRLLRDQPIKTIFTTMHDYTITGWYGAQYLVKLSSGQLQSWRIISVLCLALCKISINYYFSISLGVIFLIQQFQSLYDRQHFHNLE